MPIQLETFAIGKNDSRVKYPAQKNYLCRVFEGNPKLSGMVVVTPPLKRGCQFYEKNEKMGEIVILQW